MDTRGAGTPARRPRRANWRPAAHRGGRTPRRFKIDHKNFIESPEGEKNAARCAWLHAPSDGDRKVPPPSPTGALCRCGGRHRRGTSASACRSGRRQCDLSSENVASPEVGVPLTRNLSMPGLGLGRPAFPRYASRHPGYGAAAEDRLRVMQIFLPTRPKARAVMPRLPDCSCR